MKQTKFLVVFSLFFCMILLLSSCSKSYPFPNRNISVMEIELLYYPKGHISEAENMNFRLIRKLDPSEYNDFIKAVSSIPTGYAEENPLSDYGPFVARVTYHNGNVEYLGVRHIELVEKGDTPLGYSSHYFKGSSFPAIFFKYAVKAFSNTK